MRKTRSDSKLAKLSDEQQAQLADWLLGSMSYDVARLEVEKQFGVKVGRTAIEGFWDQVCNPIVISRRLKAVSAAQALGREIKSKGVFDAEFAEQLKQMAFEVTLEPKIDPEKVFMVISQALKLRDQELKAEQLSLAKDKFQFDAAKACLKKLPALKVISSNTSLDERAKIDRIRTELFGEDLPK